MAFLFGGAPPSTGELARRYKQQIDRAVRDIDRESAKLMHEDRTLMSEIRKFAKTNPQVATQKAQAVVRVRTTVARMSRMRSHMQDVSSRIMNVKSTDALRKALGSAVRTMQGFNAYSGSTALMGQLKEFSKQNMMMGVINDMADEGLDDAFEDEEEMVVGNVILSVFEEAGVELPDAYTRGLTLEPEDTDLEARLKRLKPPSARAL